MKIVGRKREIDTLEQSLRSKRPEFIAVYGRRRVGKTYLIREYFNNRFAFYATGMSAGKTKAQLKAFHESLMQYGDKDKAVPEDWFEAFRRLRKLLESQDAYHDPASGRLVVFLDELPWMSTARSDFKSALEYFWNSWGSAREDLVLIVCGSATSWIINNLLKDRKGFHNRITRQIQLMPFSLKECEEYLGNNDVHMARMQIIECYMIFGGIPYYLNLLDPRMSLAQNVEELCFKPYGALVHEYDNLFYSLFNHPDNYLDILQTLAGRRGGMTRKALIEKAGLNDGAGITKCLAELEECGFIRSDHDYVKSRESLYYQLIDPFTLFSIRFLKSRKEESWLRYLHQPGYNAWRGNAFEIVCLNHIDQIKEALKISGIESKAYTWKSRHTKPAAQIDLLIDRKDGVINLCEMKYTDDPFEMDQEEYQKILHRMNVFQKETGIENAVYLTLVSANKVKRNAYSDGMQNIITGDDLFQI